MQAEALDTIDGGVGTYSVLLTRRLANGVPLSVDNTAQTSEQKLLPEARTHLQEAAASWLAPSTIINNPSMYLINTQAWMTQLRETDPQQERITLGTVPNREWQRLLPQFNEFYFMGLFAPSEASREHNIQWAHEVRHMLPQDSGDIFIRSSPFAIPDYSPNPDIAENFDEIDAVVGFLHEHNKVAVVDAVLNHTARDHPWATTRPDFYIQGKTEQVNANPGAYFPVLAADGERYFLAHGKDPNHPEWHDTLQLNWANPDLREEMKGVVRTLVQHFDGARADVAMLLNSGTYTGTWGDHLTKTQKEYLQGNPVWPELVQTAQEEAAKLRKKFTFTAEAYWDKDILGTHFDRIYGSDYYKHLIRLASEKPGESVEHLRWHLIHLMTARNSGRNYDDLVYTGNHDEEQPVVEFVDKERAMAAMVVTALIPNTTLLVNQGQEDGLTYKTSMKMSRFAEEQRDLQMRAFHERLFLLKQTRLFQEGHGQVAHILEDHSTQNDSIVAQQIEARESDEGKPAMGAIVCTNFTSAKARCRLPGIGQDVDVKVINMMTGEEVDNIDDQRDGGMFVELEPWKSQAIFYAPKAA